MARIHYKEFPSGRNRYTTGRFVGWLRGGEFGLVYAVIKRRASTLFIPRQDLADAGALGAVPNPVPTTLTVETDR